MLKIIIFILLSALIIILSWRSLKSPRLHGFFRFFAFESILILILIHVSYWFHDPFSIRQIVSWLLLLMSIFLAMHGFYLLHIVGQPRGQFENTTVLVQAGAFKYIRHPLYASLLVGAWGVFFKQLSIFSLILVLIATGFLIMTAKVEEAENLHKFGSEYEDYMKSSKRFIPYIF